VTTTVTVEINEEEIDLEVEFTISKAERGARDRWGAQMEPDIEPELEIESFEPDVVLSDDQMRFVEDKCFEAANEMRSDF